MKLPAVYIMASKPRGTLYTGVTSNLVQRAYQHKEGITGGFSQRYGCKTLVYYEIGGSMEGAISREKQIKAGSREDKFKLIESMNPRWLDLYESIL
jgi:predicted GIY-YIG superfamily endonuclease